MKVVGVKLSGVKKKDFKPKKEKISSVKNGEVLWRTDFRGINWRIDIGIILPYKWGPT